LGISQDKPFSIVTCRHWLTHLGWRLTLYKKGVYKDGHEREDVVAERNNVFLPYVQDKERRMTKYRGPDLTPEPPTLLPGEKRIIALFHDECSTHANEAQKSVW
jgi:hypothetical protein